MPVREVSLRRAVGTPGELPGVIYCTDGMMVPPEGRIVTSALGIFF